MFFNKVISNLKRILKKEEVNTGELPEKVTQVQKNVDIEIPSGIEAVCDQDSIDGKQDGAVYSVLSADKSVDKVRKHAIDNTVSSTVGKGSTDAAGNKGISDNIGENCSRPGYIVPSVRDSKSISGDTGTRLAADGAYAPPQGELQRELEKEIFSLLNRYDVDYEIIRMIHDCLVDKLKFSKEELEKVWHEIPPKVVKIDGKAILREYIFSNSEELYSEKAVTQFLKKKFVGSQLNDEDIQHFIRILQLGLLPELSAAIRKKTSPIMALLNMQLKQKKSVVDVDEIMANLQFINELAGWSLDIEMALNMADKQKKLQEMEDKLNELRKELASEGGLSRPVLPKVAGKSTYRFSERDNDLQQISYLAAECFRNKDVYTNFEMQDKLEKISKMLLKIKGEETTEAKTDFQDVIKMYVKANPEWLNGRSCKYFENILKSYNFNDSRYKEVFPSFLRMLRNDWGRKLYAGNGKSVEERRELCNRAYETFKKSMDTVIASGVMASFVYILGWDELVSEWGDKLDFRDAIRALARENLDYIKSDNCSILKSILENGARHDELYRELFDDFITLLMAGYGDSFIYHKDNSLEDRNDLCKRCFVKLSAAPLYQGKSDVVMDLIKLFTYIMDWDDCDTVYRFAD